MSHLAVFNKEDLLRIIRQVEPPQPPSFEVQVTKEEFDNIIEICAVKTLYPRLYKWANVWRDYRRLNYYLMDRSTLDEFVRYRANPPKRYV